MENAVSKIYNQLYQVEKKVRKGKVYPIHKKLVFDDQQFQDIYDWLAVNISLVEGTKVLDAGCGVGYGTCLLAERCKVNITGISISEKEITHATTYSQQKELLNRVSFEKKSFDDLPKNKYDTIIAVESVKHSLNLAKTLNSFQQALKSNGQLVIIEDFYLQKEKTFDSKEYLKDWHLVDVFRLEDYYKTLPQSQCKLINLTHFMPEKSKWSINGKLTLMQLLSLFDGKDMTIHKIFKGGYYLDRLYLKKLMQYGVLIYKK